MSKWNTPRYILSQRRKGAKPVGATLAVAPVHIVHPVHLVHPEGNPRPHPCASSLKGSAWRPRHAPEARRDAVRYLMD